MKSEPLDYVTKTILTILMCYYVLSLPFKPIYQTCKYSGIRTPVERHVGVILWEMGPPLDGKGEFMKGFVLLGRMDGGRLILANDRNDRTVCM